MIFNNFPDPAGSTVIPQNYTRGKVVNKYVEHYADSQKIKQDEAIQVQGSDLVIWNRIFSKRYCTCQDLPSAINNNPAVTDDSRPNAVIQAAVDEINSLSTSEVFTKTKAKSLEATLTEAGLGDLSSLVDTLYETPITSLHTTEAELKQTKKQNSALEEAFLEQKKNLGVEHSHYVSCPICFGTRYTDLYQPHRGVRVVLDGSTFYNLTTAGAILRKNTFPYLFNLPAEGSSITWEVTLPKYFRALSVKAYNLEHQSTSVKLSFAESGSSTFNPLNLVTLQARNGLSNNLKIKCEYDSSAISEFLSDLEVNISHIEIVLLYCDDYDKGELPILTIPEQIDYQELYVRSRIVLSPRINNLTRNDLICENKYGLLWQVVDVDKIYTNGGKLLNIRADIRLVQNSEKLYSLSMFNRKMNTWRNEL